MESFDRIILIDKPAGISSFGAVSKVRWMLTEEKWHAAVKVNPQIMRKACRVKVGHCGTLDPFATGLLILVSGKWTKRAQEFAKLDKVYWAKIILGQTSSTGDPEGEIVDNQIKVIPSRDDIETIAKEYFSGDITQTPPIYSAIKVNGERAYKIARKNEKLSADDQQKIEIPSRQVTIFSLEILDYAWPVLRIRTHVSSGTYIRSLAEDLGKALDTGAYCAELRREKIGEFDVKDAQTLNEFIKED